MKRLRDICSARGARQNIAKILRKQIKFSYFVFPSLILKGRSDAEWHMWPANINIPTYWIFNIGGLLKLLIMLEYHLGFQEENSVGPEESSFVKDSIEAKVIRERDHTENETKEQENTWKEAMWRRKWLRWRRGSRLFFAVSKPGSAETLDCSATRCLSAFCNLTTICNLLFVIL